MISNKIASLRNHSQAHHPALEYLKGKANKSFAETIIKQYREAILQMLQKQEASNTIYTA